MSNAGEALTDVLAQVSVTQPRTQKEQTVSRAPEPHGTLTPTGIQANKGNAKLVLRTKQEPPMLFESDRMQFNSPLASDKCGCPDCITISRRLCGVEL